MREIIWTTEARDDLDSIIEYIEQRDEAAAKPLIEAGVERAAKFPLAFRTGRIEGTREAVLHPNYLLIFRVEKDAIVIATVLHARQQFP